MEQPEKERKRRRRCPTNATNNGLPLVSAVNFSEIINVLADMLCFPHGSVKNICEFVLLPNFAVENG